MPLYFEKPTGTKDLLPEKVRLNQRVSRKAQSFIETWGYEEVETPIIEYFKTVGLYSQIPEEKLIKFLDTSGSTVVLRPDLTTPIARFAASIYQDMELPLRLSYIGSVYRNKANYGLGLEEIKQLDVELIGVQDLTGDAEVIALAVKTILNYPISEVKVTVGHTNFLKILLAEVACPILEQKLLFNSLLERDYVGFRKIIETLSISQIYKEYLQKVLKLRGRLTDVLEARDWFNTPQWQGIFTEMADLAQILEEYEITPYINYDLTLLGSQNYYTGLIFNIYCAGHPYPLCTGGRYDNLLASFKRPAPATGFAINLDDLVKVINSEGLESQKEKTIILYSPASRLRAIKKANQLRAEGEVIVIADQDKVTEGFLQRFTKRVVLD
jgi:ATP phosphoribosyltransferase regulatory subunit